MEMGMGRVPPLMLAGEGAVQFAREQGVRVVDAPDSEEMVAPRAREEWRVWRERSSRWKGDDHGFESRSLPRGEKELEDAELEPLRVRQDTVGAVVFVGGSEARDVGQQLEVAAGVSRCVWCVLLSTFSPFSLASRATYFLPPVFSGGILLKHSGRVGEVSRRKESLILILRRTRTRPRSLVLAAGRNDWLVDAALPVASRDKGNLSCNHFWLEHWLRGPLRVPTAIRTRFFDPYW